MFRVEAVQPPPHCLAALNEIQPLASALGTENFQDSLIDVLNQTVVVDHLSAFAQTADDDDDELLWVAASSRSHDGQSPAVARRYVQHFRHMDPARPALRQFRHTSRLVISQHTYRDVVNALYRHECYERPGIVERLSVHAVDGTTRYSLNCYRVSSSGYFDDREVEELLRLAHFVMPFLARQSTLNGARGQQARQARLSLDEITRQLGDLRQGLSDRELAVCARALYGLSAEATAMDLNIKVTSVFTYRRRAYQKLGVSCLNELFRLIL